MSDVFESWLNPPEVPLSVIDSELYRRAGIQVGILRLDLIHPEISGNKWFKLKHNLASLPAGSRVISFGGAYSNHIHALAFAGRQQGLKTVGVIRGEESSAENPSLSDARKWGMELVFVSREQFRNRHDKVWLADLARKYDGGVIVPEGGSNANAVKGAAEIVELLPPDTDVVVLPVGTGGTLAGVVSAFGGSVIGVPVLKGADFLYEDVKTLLSGSGLNEQADWMLDLDGHFGGYGRLKPEVASFKMLFEQRYGVELDCVYTAKMVLAFNYRVVRGLVPEGSRIVLLHTGGIQGNRGMIETLYDQGIKYRGVLPV